MGKSQLLQKNEELRNFIQEKEKEIIQI